MMMEYTQQANYHDEKAIAVALQIIAREKTKWFKQPVIGIGLGRHEIAGHPTDELAIVLLTLSEAFLHQVEQGTLFAFIDPIYEEAGFKIHCDVVLTPMFPAYAPPKGTGGWPLPTFNSRFNPFEWRHQLVSGLAIIHQGANPTEDVSVEESDYGSLGCFIRITSKQVVSPTLTLEKQDYLLTCCHVLRSSYNTADKSLYNVEQPPLLKWIDPYKTIPTVLCGIYQFGLLNSYLDVAIASVSRPTANLIPGIDSNLRSLKGLGKAVIGDRVYKYGALTGYTEGIVKYTHLITPARYNAKQGESSARKSTYEVIPDDTMEKAPEKQLAFPEQFDERLYVVKINPANGQETNEAFGSGGDSGSAVVRKSDDCILGLLTGTLSRDDKVLGGIVADIAIQLRSLPVPLTDLAFVVTNGDSQVEIPVTTFFV